MEFLSVADILKLLDLKDSMTGAEFGCGSAHFALALAKKLKKGRVYALDIQEEKLSAVKGKAAIEKLNNIITIRCDLEKSMGSTLPDHSVDVLLIPNLLFQVPDKNAILAEGYRVLKPGGHAVVIDGAAKPAEVKSLAEKNGLRLKKEYAAGDYHYALLFTK